MFVDRQAPLRFVEIGKSEDPKYHDNPEGIQIRQVPLPMTQMATTEYQYRRCSKKPVDVKFRVVDPKPP